MDRTAVLIPCFNEALTIKKVVEDWKRELPEAKIYVYDNNSTDGTAIAKEAGAIVRHEYRQGKGKSMINFIFGSDVRDIMTGFHAISYRFVKSFPVVSQGFEIETEMTIHAIDKNMLLKNMIIDYTDRKEGSVSKLNTFSDGIKVIRTILHLFCDYRPLCFFSVIAALLLLVSGLFFAPIVNEYLATGLVPRQPTLIACGFGAISALLSFFAGVILQTIKNNERREFEFRLKEVEEWRKLHRKH